MIVTRFRNCSDLVREGKVFVKNKTKVASGVGCSERAVVYFRELLFKSNKKTFSLEELRVRRLAVIQEEICCRGRYVTSNTYCDLAAQPALFRATYTPNRFLLRGRQQIFVFFAMP